MSIFKGVTNSVSKREEFNKKIKIFSDNKEIEDKNLKQKLISFCIKHFNDYKPEL